MKLQATIVLDGRAGSHEEAGRTLDELLAAVGEHRNVRVDRVELTGPPERMPVTIPPPAPSPAAEAPPPRRRPEPSLRG